MTTLSRSVICSICGNSAEDENGEFIICAPDCTENGCSRANEPYHFHTTYSTIFCLDCHEKVGDKRLDYIIQWSGEIQ